MMGDVSGNRCEMDGVWVWVRVMRDVVEAAGDSRSTVPKGHDSGAGVAAAR